jgi:hypothetical protein
LIGFYAGILLASAEAQILRRREDSMKTLRTLAAGSLIVLLGLASPAAAQDRHVMPASAIGQALANQADQDQAHRTAIKNTLARQEVRAVALKAGIDLARATAAVDTMSDDQLAQAAAVADRVDQSLAGGASTVTISTTTIIIALLIIILIVVAAD